jgi:hypothetical protein
MNSFPCRSTGQGEYRVVSRLPNVTNYADTFPIKLSSKPLPPSTKSNSLLLSITESSFERGWADGGLVQGYFSQHTQNIPPHEKILIFSETRPVHQAVAIRWIDPWKSCERLSDSISFSPIVYKQLQKQLFFSKLYLVSAL